MSDTVAQQTTRYTFVGIAVLELAAYPVEGRGVDFSLLEHVGIDKHIYVGFKLGWPSSTNEEALKAKERMVRKITGLEPHRYTLYVTTTLVKD